MFDSESFEGELFDDYSDEGYWDNSATIGQTIFFLESIIFTQSLNLKIQWMPITPHEACKKLVWLNEQGIDYNLVNKDAPLVVQVLTTILPQVAFIHLLWGTSAGDDTFFQAGVNHFADSIIQDSRSDGSITIEVKPSS